MDLRFAPFADEQPTPESKALEEAEGDVCLLETSATGKTSSIFAVGRRKYLIYIRCVPPKTGDVQTEPNEFSHLPEKLYAEVVGLIEHYCDIQTTTLDITEAREREIGRAHV